MRRRVKVDGSDLVGPYFGFRCATTYRDISDHNNGKYSRPESECKNIYSRYRPTLVQTSGTDPNMNPQAHVNIPCDQVAGYIETLAQDPVNGTVASCYRSLNSAISKTRSSFSSLNFVYELRELGGLYKSLDKYRYIDWQFGIAPMISDVKKLVSHHQELARKTKSAAYGSRRSFTSVKRSTTRVEGTISLGISNPHEYAANIDVSTRLSGEIGTGFPYLAGVSPEVFKILDQLAIDPSAGNAWEMVPWSWFVDWFLPVGQALQNIPSFMNPEVTFYGRLTTKVQSLVTFKSVYAYPYEYEGGSFCGQGIVKIYHRQPITGAFSTPFSIGHGLAVPSNIALLRDIVYPSQKKKDPFASL